MKKKNTAPIPETITYRANELIHLGHYIGDAFTGPWHFHPEYELVLIVKSKGKRIVGDHVASYNKNDCVFIGPYVPHTWISENSEKRVEAIVLQFRPELIHGPFLNQPELKHITITLYE